MAIFSQIVKVHHKNLQNSIPAEIKPKKLYRALHNSFMVKKMDVLLVGIVVSLGINTKEELQKIAFSNQCYSAQF